MIDEALKLYGVLEAPGSDDNPQILAWARETGLDDVYTHDEIAWCGLFAAVVAQRAGKRVPAGPLWALNWKRFGVPSPEAGLGDMLVFKRPGGGHVGLYVGEDENAFHCLGGNTRDSVSIARIARNRLVAVRRPEYKIGKPAGVRPYILATGGALSTNEA